MIEGTQRLKLPEYIKETLYLRRRADSHPYPAHCSLALNTTVLLTLAPIAAASCSLTLRLSLINVIFLTFVAVA